MVLTKKKSIITAFFILAVLALVIFYFFLERNSPYSEETILENEEVLKFAVIGDYGSDSQAELDVANLVKSWNPDAVLTVGDNNYKGWDSSSAIIRSIGEYYCEFIKNNNAPPEQVCINQITKNKFWPSLGNHDWGPALGDPPLPIYYLNYFDLPGNERYYDFIEGNVHFFVLDSDPNSGHPDGHTFDSIQGKWLEKKLKTSKDNTDNWNIVYFHHAPYTSSSRGSNSEHMRWPFKEWGTDAVLAGHEHLYERLEADGIPYFVNGLGGKSIYSFGAPIKESRFVYNKDYGAMLITTKNHSLWFEFYSRDGILHDKLILTK